MPLRNALENVAVSSKQDTGNALLQQLVNLRDGANGTITAGTGSAAPSATVTLASLTSPGTALRGFTATGNGDGYFTLQANSATLLAGRIRFAQPSVSVFLPAGITIPNGQIIQLSVTNEANQTCNYQGAILTNG